MVFVVKSEYSLNKLAFLTVLSVLLASLAMPAPFKVGAVGSTIYVPDDYPSIQDAVGNASSGDRVIVRAGHTNYGPVYIDKELTVQGQNQYNTIINGNGCYDAVTITADNVLFTKFTVFNCTDQGVLVSGENVTLDTCFINDCGNDGVYFSYANNSTLKDSVIHDCGGDAVYITNSRNSSVINCDLTDNYRGFQLSNALSFNITGCEVLENSEENFFMNSDYGVIKDCVFFNHTDLGIRMDHCDGIQVLDSHICFNEDDGMQIWGCDRYLIHGCEFYNNSEGLDDLFSIGSVIDDCYFYDNSFDGISLYSSGNFKIKNCTSFDNRDGINLHSSDIISICNSSFCGNFDDGVDSHVSHKLYLACTNVNSNSDEGFEFDQSQGVAVDCNFSGNQKGVDAVNSVFTARFCRFEDNVHYGIDADSNSVVNASDCWWGNSTGPYHWSDNPTGTGDQVSNIVEFIPWQTEPYQPRDLISNLRCILDKVLWRVVYPDQSTPKPLGCGAALTSDWLASAFVTTKLHNYVEGLDTNSSFVDQVTGEAVGDPGVGILSFGGPFVNPVVKRAENDSTPDPDRAPVKFYDDSGIFRFQYKNGTNIPGAELPLSVINLSEDLFVIEVFTDGDGRRIMLCYGFGWPGTYAAGKFFDAVVFPHLAAFRDSWVIIHWEDSNSDRFVNDPGEGDTYSLVASGY